MKLENGTLRWKRGQNTAEYLIMLVLVAVGSIGLFSAFGSTLKKQLNNAVLAFSGKGESMDENFSTEIDHAKRSIDAGSGMNQGANVAKRLGGSSGGGSGTGNQAGGGSQTPAGG